MARRVDLTGENVTRSRRKGQQYGTKTDLSSTTVDRGSTHWMNESYVAIDGVLDVTGTTTISGALNVSGTTTLSGATTIAGPTGITGALTIAGSTDITGPLTVQGITTISGQLDVTGPTTLAGTLDITGDTTLTGNMDVIGGGKITVGNTILSPGAANGGVEFASGGGIGGNAGTVAMRGSANAGFLALSTEIASMFGGTSQIDVKSADVTIASTLINLNAPQTSVNGNLVVTGTASVAGIASFASVSNFAASLRNTGRSTTGNAANVHITSTGYFFEVTSSERFKLDVQPLELPDSLLDVPIVDWIDRTSQENYDRLNDAPRPFELDDQIAFDTADLTRIPGALAEAVEAAGGRAFVSHGEDGLPRALAYDRYALARTELLVRRLNAAIKRIAALEGPTT